MIKLRGMVYSHNADPVPVLEFGQRDQSLIQGSRYSIIYVEGGDQELHVPGHDIPVGAQVTIEIQAAL